MKLKYMLGTWNHVYDIKLNHYWQVYHTRKNIKYLSIINIGKNLLIEIKVFERKVSYHPHSVLTFLIVRYCFYWERKNYLSNLKIVTATSNFRGQREEEERQPNRIRIQKTELDISDFVVLDNMELSVPSLQHSASPFSFACCLKRVGL